MFVAVQVSECAHPEIRGILGSLPSLFTAVGVLLSYILGSWLAWDHLALVSALFPAALFVLLLPLPESPSWLRSRGRRQDAEDAARWLHHAQVVNIELYTVPSPADAETPPTSVAGVEKKPEIPAGSKKSIARGAYSADALLRRPVVVPFVLVSAIMVFQQFSGIDTVLFYTVSIFEATGGDVNDYLATILVGFTQVLGTIVSMFIIDKYGRRPLLIFSGFVMGLSMAALGFYFYVHDRNLPITSSLGLLPVTSLMTFIAAFAVGYCNVPYILMGELLPVGQRSVLSSVASAFCLGSMFVVIKSYHDIEQLIGNEGVFWGYAALCFVSCVFVTALLPETKGKSLEEIEGYFESKAQRRKEKQEKKAAEKQIETSST